MSHGECDDWWDAFSCPQWFVEFLEDLSLIERGNHSIMQVKFVEEKYKKFTELKSKWHNHS